MRVRAKYKKNCAKTRTRNDIRMTQPMPFRFLMPVPFQVAATKLFYYLFDSSNLSI